MSRYLKSLQIVMLVIFFAIILLPELNHFFHFIPEVKGNENRTKSKKPEFDISRLDAFVKEYDNYYTDNFSLRENGILFHNKLEYFTLGVSPVPNEVVVGKEGWFYDKNCLDNYTGSNAFSPNDLLTLKKELAYRSKWASEKNIKYLLVVVPNKMNVYPEYLPDNIIKVSEQTRYDQVMTLDGKSGINIVDVRKILLDHKKDGYDLFQRTDGHWNDLGAYYGYQAIINRLSEYYSELKSNPLSDYTINIEKRPGGSIVSMISLSNEYPEKFVKLTEKNKTYAYDGKKRPYEVPKTISAWDHQIVKENDHVKKLKCLIIRDSFTLLLVRYLQEHFSESVFIHDEWKYRMREDLIENEKPDIVLTIVLENELNKLLEYPFLVTK
jgi:alginate O-acetyltransferase complex protein AlgJ